jgi:hypothetical protein
MRKLEDNIKMGLKEIQCGNVNQIHHAWDRDLWRALVNTVMNLRAHRREVTRLVTAGSVHPHESPGQNEMPSSNAAANANNTPWSYHGSV